MGHIFDVDINQGAVVEGIVFKAHTDQVRWDFGIGGVTIDTTGKIVSSYTDGLSASFVPENDMLDFTGVMNCTSRMYTFINGQMVFPLGAVNAEYIQPFYNRYQTGTLSPNNPREGLTDEDVGYFKSALKKYRIGLDSKRTIPVTIDMFFETDNPLYRPIPEFIAGDPGIESVIDELTRLRDLYQAGVWDELYMTPDPICIAYTVEEMFEMLRVKWGDDDVNTTKVKAIGGGFSSLMRSEGIPEFRVIRADNKSVIGDGTYKQVTFSVTDLSPALDVPLQNPGFHEAIRSPEEGEKPMGAFDIKSDDIVPFKVVPRPSRMKVVGSTLTIKDIPSSKLFPGDRLFELKATHGVPLDVSISAILNKGKNISWVPFIDQARKNKMWDFQTIELMTQSLEDAGVDPDYKTGVISRAKLYILNNPI